MFVGEREREHDIPLTVHIFQACVRAVQCIVLCKVQQQEEQGREPHVQQLCSGDFSFSFANLVATFLLFLVLFICSMGANI
jgi:hypothetical protein